MQKIKLLSLTLASFLAIPYIAVAFSDLDLAKCANIKNNVQRLTCFDQLAREAGVDRPMVDSKYNGNWEVFTTISPIDDSTNVNLLLHGDSEFKGWIEHHYPTLILRCKENKTEMFIVTGMAPNVEYGGDQATATIRYDKDDAFTLEMSKSTDEEALFFPDAISEIKKMMRHKKMLFRFTPFKASPTMTTFDVSGLEEAVKPIRKHCGW